MEDNQVKINQLQIENVKRVKAVAYEPTATGLSIIGGNNNQGKTSVLDAIAWALGGNDFKPSNATREGSTIPPNLKVKLSNGIVVERKGKNSTLKVTDPEGKKAGQTLLNEFVEKLAIDLPKFMNSSNKEKARTLLKIIGVEEELARYEQEENELYQERLAIGRIADQKKKHAAEQIEYPGVPGEPVSPQELINQQQAILAKNGENQRKRERVHQIEYKTSVLEQEYASLLKQVEAKKIELDQSRNDLTIAKTDALDLVDESTEELERNLAEIEEVNRRIRANLDKQKAEDDAKEYEDKYKDFTSKIEKVRKDKLDLLKSADLPLPGLSVEDGELTYNGKKWDGMSGSDQLKVSTAIVRKLNPKCGFVLLDKLEQMDLNTLNEFGKWLESEGLQAIATRVSTGDECSIIIEDGMIKGNYIPKQEEPSSRINQDKKWKAGEF